MPGSQEMVFRHLTEPELLTTWWPSDADVDLREGGRYHFRWAGPGWHLRGQYHEVAPPRRLTFTWSWDHDDIEPRVVDIVLEPMGDGTLIVLEHEAGSTEERQDYETGWTHFLGLLVERLGSVDR